MASSQYNNYIVAPNPAAAAPSSNYPSGCNVVGYSTTSWDITLPAISAGAIATNVVSIASSNTSNANYTYRLTADWIIPTATFATAAAGNMTLFANIGARNIAASSAYARGTTITGSTPAVAGCLSVVFAGNNAITFSMANDTTANLNSGATLTFYSFSIETISTSNFVKNTWT